MVHQASIWRLKKLGLPKAVVTEPHLGAGWARCYFASDSSRKDRYLEFGWQIFEFVKMVAGADSSILIFTGWPRLRLKKALTV